jgi:hypothetical protein
MALDDRRSYFSDDSMLRRVIRETVVAFSTPRTLLMQAAHPVAFAGFFEHTGAWRCVALIVSVGGRPALR